MSGPDEMIAPVTQAQLRTELDQLEERLDQRLDQRLEKFATKEYLDQRLEEFATKQDLERFATKQDLERFATKQDLERFATKQDLETWGFALRAELFAALELWGGKIIGKLEVELARHVTASREEMRALIGVVDEKYRDLPDRVTRLEHIVDER